MASWARKIFAEGSDTCVGTPDAVVIFEEGKCNEGDCARSKYGNYTYHVSDSCNTSSPLTTIAEAFSASDEYLVFEMYAGSGCSELGQRAAYSFGTCLTVDGKISIQSTHLPNGTGKVSYFNNTDCDGDSYLEIEAGSGNSSQDCQYGVYKAYSLYSERSASSSSSSSASDSRSASIDDSVGISSSEAASAASQGSELLTVDGETENSGISSGAIAGIVVAALVVSCLVIGFLWFRRHANKNSEGSGADKHSGAYALASPSSGQKKTDTGTTALSKSEPQRLAGLLDDEVIATARIPREKVVIERSISRGGGGEVYVGLYNQQQVAIKMLLPETRKSVKHVNAFLAEVKLMATLEHARIVLFIGVAWDSLTDLCVVSEFMEGGDLRALLTSYEKERHPRGFDRTKVTIALHVAHALTYLHSLETPVLHRDLKSKNVLLTAELEAKLTDFGISRERADDMTAGVGTSLWMAPEVMLGQRYDDKADMFSFGIVLSELDRQALPYADAKDKYGSDTAILQLVAQGKIHVEFSSGVLESMVSLGHSCVALDAKDRPTAAQALYRLQTILSKEM